MKKYAYIALGLIFVAGLVWLIVTPGKSGPYDGFAQCLKDKGALFYGAFWCPHCQNQKALFGKSVKYLPYIECSTPDGRGQVQMCNDIGINTYPTWFIPDPSSTTPTRLTGEISLEELSEKTSCALPS